MAWEQVSCPYCGYSKPIAVNVKVKQSMVNCTCSKCHERYAYQATYGKVIVIKK